MELYVEGSSRTKGIFGFCLKLEAQWGGGLGVRGHGTRASFSPQATFTTRNSHFGAVRVRGCP